MWLLICVFSAQFRTWRSSIIHLAAKDIIGLVPAAGHGTRLGVIGHSKELFPLNLRREAVADFDRPPTVVSEFLLEAFARAGIQQTIFIVRDGKWDILRHFGDGSHRGLSIAYMVANNSPGVPWTIDTAFRFVAEKTVAFGFPDMLFEPRDIFTPLLNILHDRKADVVLALMPSESPETADVVCCNSDMVVSGVFPKPEEAIRGLVWMGAVWQPSFSAFLHDQIAGEPRSESGGELYLGEIFQRALSSLTILAVPIANGRFVDIGTREDAAKALERLF